MSKPTEKTDKPDTFIYSYDYTKKVNLTTSTKLADLLKDRGMCRQGDNSQLWKTKSGAYFRGSCLEHAFTYGPKTYHFIEMSKAEARMWTLTYLGPEWLKQFGLADLEDECQEI